MQQLTYQTAVHQLFCAELTVILKTSAYLQKLKGNSVCGLKLKILNLK